MFELACPNISKIYAVLLNMYEFLHPSWKNILQILITAPVLYLLVIISIRVIGNRSTSQMNNFDWIVTVAVGGIFASAVILQGTNLIEGAFGIALLLLLQYMVTLLVRRSKLARKILKATPQLLVYEGEFLRENMAYERIIQAEVLAAIRNSGYKSLNEVYAVVLETNAQMSVIPNAEKDLKGFSLSDVGGLPEGLRSDLKDRGEEDDNDQSRDKEEEDGQKRQTSRNSNNDQAPQEEDQLQHA